MSKEFLSPCCMSLWTASCTMLHIYILWDKSTRGDRKGMVTTWWSSTASHQAFLLPRRSFIMQESPLLYFEEICNGWLSAFACVFEPIVPPGGHLQALIPRPRRTAGHWGIFNWWRRYPPHSLRHSRRCHRPHHAAAVKHRHILAAKLLPFDAGVLPRSVALEIKVPALVGYLHAHAQQPLEVLLQLLVVYRPEEVPAHRPHLQPQGLNATKAGELQVGCGHWYCCWCWCWWRGHCHVPSASVCVSL